MSHPVPRAPAPWSTKSECYWLLLNLSKLPEGVYDPLETPAEPAGEFKGGLGMIMIVRYWDTPVGPYDELLLIPGNFTVPKPNPTTPNTPPTLPKKALRITRIYVSQRTTVYNGRLNWNIPKHLARFHFSHPTTSSGTAPPKSLTISVYPPTSKEGDGTAPFFAATLRPWRWVPAIPTSTRWMPLSTVHAQPPIPKKEVEGGEDPFQGTETERGIDAYDLVSDPSALLVGTEHWRTFAVNAYSPRSRGCWVEVHVPGGEKAVDGEGEGEGEGEAAVDEAKKFWPEGVRPWRVGAWMEDAEMYFPKAVEFKL